MSTVMRVSLLAGIVAAAAFTGGRWNIPVAVWIGAVLTLYWYRSSTRPVVDYLVVSALVGAVGAVTWHGVVPAVVTAPLPTAVVPVSGAFIGMLVYVLDRWVYRRVGPTVPASLVFPTAFTALDWLSTSSPDVGTFGSQAYTQVGSPLVQLAAVGGMPLVVFMLAWAASLTVLVVERRGDTPRAAWVGVGLVALALGFGWVRPWTAPTAESTVTVAGVSLPNSALVDALSLGVESDGFRGTVARTHDRLTSEAERIAPDADLIVFQEAAAFGTGDEVARLRSQLGELATRHGTWVVLPTLVLDADPIVNAVEVLDPRGEVVLTHVKYGGNVFEGSQLGDAVLQVVDTPFGRLSAVVCWDADFPEVLRQAGAADVDLMVVPANDWYEVRDIHADMATVRAVENGMAVVRQTGSGVSLVADSHGRQLHRVDSFRVLDTAPGEQHVQLELRKAPALFPVIGQTLGLLCGVATVGVLGWLLVERLRSRRVRKQAAESASRA